jgi:regulator of protease activity HflC (stomatin/prohibitin superfamily)
MKGSNNVATWLVIVAVAIVAGVVATTTGSIVWGASMLVGLVIAASPRVIKEWEVGILLRLGKFKATLGRGLVWIVPGVDTLITLVDMRVRSTAFSAEDTLTKDTVPVNVDAVLFWAVADAERAVIGVEDFESTIGWVAQTTLRDVIGRSELSRMISDREALDEELQVTIGERTTEWGITVYGVEIRDVMIPKTLEDAMSRRAQAERERESRIILADSEPLVAERMRKAAAIYKEDPYAMRLRAMNITYESIKESGGLMVVPSGMSDSINPGVLGMVAADLMDVPHGNGDKGKSGSESSQVEELLERLRAILT